MVYQFRLKRMPKHRLPSMVQSCRWQQSATSKRPAMHSEQVKAAEKMAHLNVDEHAAKQATSYAAFKTSAAKAIRTADMRQLTDTDQSTLKRCLDAHADTKQFPTKMRDYLHGPLTDSMRTKLMFTAGFAPVNHMLAKQGTQPQDTGRSRTTAGQDCPFCPCSDETQEHFVLECPAFDNLRQPALQALELIVGADNFQKWQCLTAAQRLHRLLNG